MTDSIPEDLLNAVAREMYGDIRSEQGMRAARNLAAPYVCAAAPLISAQATADLRAGIEALRDEWRKEAAQLRLDADSGAYGTATRAVATVADIRADALDALLRGA